MQQMQQQTTATDQAAMTSLDTVSPTSPRTLTPAEIAHFIRYGYVTVRQAIPAHDAQRMLDDTWAVFGAHGIVRDLSKTWPEKYKVPRELQLHATFDRIASPRFVGAVDDLVGAGTWNLPPKPWGLIRVNFPERTTAPWDLSACGWHWDSAPSTTHAAVFACVHIGETVPGGAATLMVAGSPRVFAHHYARRRFRPGRKVHRRDLVDDHPWFKGLATGAGDQAAYMRDFLHRSTIDADGHELRVVEATGMPGDVTLFHPTMYHSGSLNRAHCPRIMRFFMVPLKRERPAPGTPMAASVLPLA
jgi:hypothetical protein